MLSDEPTDQETLNNMHAFINHMLKFVQNLILVNSDGVPTKIATGFLIKKEGRFFLISALHAIGESGQWMIETPIVTPAGTHSLSIRLGEVVGPSDFPVFAPGESGEKIDLSWCEFHVQRLQEAFKSDPLLAGKKWEPIAYHGPLDIEPVAGEAYSYAAWNHATLLLPPSSTHAQLKVDTSLLKRQPTFEIGMDFIGTTECGLYRFQPTQPRDLNKQYKGASGAPIARPDGGIVAVAVQYDPVQHEILGVPLSKFGFLIGIEPRKGPDGPPIN
jgi:hypothetical protein